MKLKINLFPLVASVERPFKYKMVMSLKYRILMKKV